MRRWPRCLALLGFAAALVAAPAAARVVVAPWSGNFAFVGTESRAGGVADSNSAAPPSAAAWSASPFSDAHNDTTDASAFANLTMSTSFSDTVFAVASSGFGFANGPGTLNRGGAVAYVQFYAERTQSFLNYPVFSPGAGAGVTTVAFVANLLGEHLPLILLWPSEVTTGRLAPGLYSFYYSNHYGPSPGNAGPNSFSTQLGLYDVADPLVAQHPQSQTVPAGNTASFSVSASGTANKTAGGPGLTYQWRRSYLPLTDGGRISGATSPQLQIANAAVTDSGVYDCLVSQGPIAEPSSLARLTVTEGTTDVEPAERPAGIALAAPSPNPSARSTRLRFVLPRATEVTLEVLDVTGRRVRRLLADAPLSAGAHEMAWDGDDETLRSVRAGIYLIRLAGGSEVRVRRMVRLAD